MSVDEQSAERKMIFVLAAIQFCHILDFVILMPLGPQLMRSFGMTPQQFSWVVTAYMVSASFFGFMGVFFLDRFDRKKALVLLFAGFLLGTLGCALARSYEVLFFARAFAGSFGGLLTAVVHTIIGDLIPPERQGKATGVVMAAFSVSAVLGVPFGLFLANSFSWHTPFFFIVATGLLMGFFSFHWVPKVDAHLQDADNPYSKKEILDFFRHPRYLFSFSLILFLMLGGFSVIPFIAPYLVKNVGITEHDLTWVYFFGGLVTFFTSRKLGDLSDRLGRFRVFATTAGISVVPILLLTHLPKSDLLKVILVTTLFMVFVNGRFVCATALLQTVVDNRRRGSFMSLLSAVRQISAGLASFLSGLMIAEASNGTLLHYNEIGIFASGMSLISVGAAAFLVARFLPKF